MESNSGSRVSKAGLKRFVRHLAIVTKKHHEREDARISLKRQIQRVRDVSLNRQMKGYVLDSELRSLNEKIGKMLEKESNVLFLGKENNAIVNSLKNQVQLLQNRLLEEKKNKDFELSKFKDRVSNLNETMAMLKNHVDDFINAKEEHKKRVSHIENKIKAKFDSSFNDIMDLSYKVAELEKEYAVMQKEGIYSNDELKRVEDKIDLLKDKLEKVRVQNW